MARRSCKQMLAIRGRWFGRCGYGPIGYHRAMHEPTHHPAATVPGRSCGDCAMCCKLLEIKALNKPANEWCVNCSTRKGCDIYETRPQTCHNFNCGYMTQGAIGEEWWPTTARMMITYTGDGKHLFIQVDPTRPDAWRREPYYSQLKNWARINNPNGQQIIVAIAGRYIVIFPEREVDVGHVAADETVTFSLSHSASGPVTEVRKVKVASLG